jgi:hypothetical protein
VQALTTAQKIYAVDTARQKNLDAGEREWGESWHPFHWLTWVMLGVPCTEYEGFVMDTLAVGRPGTQAETTEALAGRQQINQGSTQVTVAPRMILYDTIVLLGQLP